ncbi:ninjurin-2-like [Saccoglossus kowalevskii]|uniref:Ninjurin-2-like n=1 Tax=Saccoglossus kowalevskii TaxID=10224 RepID=A0ABM0GL60_SACKO|nr:PREDICTED: ninjurin-2-like [Saccoglossus kowalevskii]
MSESILDDDGIRRRRCDTTNHSEETTELQEKCNVQVVVEDVGSTKSDDMEDSVINLNQDVKSINPNEQNKNSPLLPPSFPLHQRSRSSTYASTKTVAQGFLNMSLLSANAGQLKGVLLQGPSGDFYYMLITLIVLSMVLQLCVSIILALKYFVDFDDDGVDEEEKKTAIQYNNVATITVMFVSAINVVISVFIG